MPSCWYVHTEQGDDSNSSPAAGLCSSAGLSDGGGASCKHCRSIPGSPRCHIWRRLNAVVLQRGRERGKSSASLLATQSICIQPVEAELPCYSGPSAKKIKKNKKIAHTDQTKAAEHRAALSLPSPQQVPESSLERGGLASVLSWPPWGHLPLMRILIYAGAFKAVLIGCIVALYDSSSTHMVLVGVCCFPSLFVFWFLFFFFCTFTCALCVDVVQKIISLAYSHISPVWKKSEASHSRPLITNDKLMKTWECSIGGQQKSNCGRLKHSFVSSAHKFTLVCCLALC